MTEVARRGPLTADAPAGRLRRRLRAPLTVAAARLGPVRGAPFSSSWAWPRRRPPSSPFSAAASSRGIEPCSVARRTRAVRAKLPRGRLRSARRRGLRRHRPRVRAALAPLAAGTPLRATFFRELRIDGELVQLGGVDSLDSLVRLRTGRLPRVCSPARCEVLQVGTGGTAPGSTRRHPSGSRRHRSVPVVPCSAGSIDTEQQGGDNPTLLLAAGARTFDSLPAFDGLYRIYSWIVPLDPRRLHIWEIGRVLDRETRAQTELAARATSISSAARMRRSSTRARRVALQHSACCSSGVRKRLLLGFALVAAMGLRRGLANEGRRLLQRGARRSQVWLSATAEIAATTVAGSLAGAACGVGVVAVVARSAGLPAGAVLAHSVVTALGLGVVAPPGSPRRRPCSPARLLARPKGVLGAFGCSTSRPQVPRQPLRWLARGGLTPRPFRREAIRRCFWHCLCSSALSRRSSPSAFSAR